MPIDILYGSSRLREAVDAGKIASVIDSAKHDEEQFLKIREEYLLY